MQPAATRPRASTAWRERDALIVNGFRVHGFAPPVIVVTLFSPFRFENRRVGFSPPPEKIHGRGGLEAALRCWHYSCRWPLQGVELAERHRPAPRPHHVYAAFVDSILVVGVGVHERLDDDAEEIGRFQSGPWPPQHWLAWPMSKAMRSASLSMWSSYFTIRVRGIIGRPGHIGEAAAIGIGTGQRVEIFRGQEVRRSARPAGERHRPAWFAAWG